MSEPHVPTNAAELAAAKLIGSAIRLRDAGRVKPSTNDSNVEWIHASRALDAAVDEYERAVGAA